jgi:hypothetical protein
MTTFIYYFPYSLDKSKFLIYKAPPIYGLGVFNCVLLM